MVIEENLAFNLLSLLEPMTTPLGICLKCIAIFAFNHKPCLSIWKFFFLFFLLWDRVELKKKRGRPNQSIMEVKYSLDNTMTFPIFSEYIFMLITYERHRQVQLFYSQCFCYFRIPGLKTSLNKIYIRWKTYLNCFIELSMWYSFSLNLNKAPICSFIQTSLIKFSHKIQINTIYASKL